MNCKNCGAPLSDGAAFCGNCGTPVEKEVENQVNAATEPLTQQQDAAAQAPAAEAFVQTPAPDNFAQVQFDAPEEPKAKKGKGLLLKLGIPVVAIIAVVAIVLNFGTLAGTAIKTFGSPSSYLNYVETQSLGGYADSITTLYDAYLIEGVKMDRYAEAKLDVELGESALELLKQSTSMDWKWLNDLGIKVNANMQDTTESMNMALMMGEESILSMDMIMDIANAGMYVAIPEMSDQYLYMDIEETSTDLSDVATDSISTEEMDKVLTVLEKVLPSEDSLNSLVDKYIKIVLENMEDVEKDTETVEVDDIEQKLTTLEFEFTEETALNIAVAVLKEVKEDSEIKKIIENAQDALVEEDFIDESEESAYDAFIEAVDDALDSLEDVDPSDEELFTLVDYVNNKHEVVGRAIEVSGEEILRYVTVYKGSEFATEADVAQGQFTFAGTGTEKSGVITGEFEMAVQGMDVLTMSVEKFDADKAKEGYLNGNFKLEPSATLLDELGVSVVSAMNPAVEINCETSDSKANIAINVLTGDKLFAGITISSVSKAGQKITIPDDSKTVDMDDADEWANSLDFDKVIENLKKTDIPDELIDVLEALVDGGLGSVMYGSADAYDDSYSYDYGYGDDYSDTSDYYEYF